MALEIFKSYKENCWKSQCSVRGHRLDAGQVHGAARSELRGKQTEMSIGTKFCVILSRSLKNATPLHLRIDFKVSFQRINVDSLRNAEVEPDIKDRYNSEYGAVGTEYERSEVLEATSTRSCQQKSNIPKSCYSFFSWRKG